jgi:hypothetical protein
MAVVPGSGPLGGRMPIAIMGTSLRFPGGNAAGLPALWIGFRQGRAGTTPPGCWQPGPT